MDRVELVVRVIAETAVANEQYFSDLDAVVGDGDFGHSLARGFEGVLDEFAELDRQSPGAFLKRVAIILTGKVGGASGPLWGTAFLRAGVNAGDKRDLTGADAVSMLRAAIDGIRQRGNADPGDKTLLDALIPATDELERQLGSGADGAALSAAAQVAREAAEATRGMLAKRGRASYTGERSIGSLDAGAVAVATIFEHVAEAWARERDMVS
jgi:dihydroxyacetone kinase-like protein